MISFLFPSRAAPRWLAHRREHTLLGNPGSLRALQSGKPLHLNPIRLSLMSLFTFLPTLPALRQPPFKGYLYFRLKQSCFSHGRLSAQQYHAVPRVGAHILPTFPFSGFALPPFGSFTAESAAHTTLGRPPSPATARHSFSVPRGWSRDAVLPSSSLSPGRGRGRGAASSARTSQPAPRTPSLRPAPRAGQWQLRRDPPGSFERDLLHRPCKLSRGLSLKVTVPCAQQHILDGFALQNFPG